MDMEFHARASGDKRRGLEFGDRGRAIFIQWLKDDPGSLLKITPVLPESDKQRRFFEGAVVPLIVHYQEGLAHRIVGCGNS
jgi:hypothetical protein